SPEIRARRAVQPDRNEDVESCGMRHYSRLAGRPLADRAPPRNELMMPPTFPPPQGGVFRADMLKKWRYSMMPVAAGAFGFLTFNHAFADPDLYGASSLFGG